MHSHSYHHIFYVILKPLHITNESKKWVRKNRKYRILPKLTLFSKTSYQKNDTQYLSTTLQQCQILWSKKQKQQQKFLWNYLIFYNGLIWKRQLHKWHGSNVCLGLLRIHVTSLNLIINIWGSYTMVIFNGIFVYSENFWKYREIHVEELYSMADGDLKLF